MSPAPYALGFRTLDSETSIPDLPIAGTFPPWLRGTLLRNGPALFEVGDERYNHWFDGLAMLHAFTFEEGHVQYANRFLRSDAFREAESEGKISRREFATDPCYSLFQRVMSVFDPELTDNAGVSINRFGDETVALTETRLAVRFDPRTLETLGVFDYQQAPGDDVKVDVSIAHPHFDAARNQHYTYFLEFGRTSTYRLVSIDASTGEKKVVTSIPERNPAYMHSFAMSERHLILTEFPLVVNPLVLLFSGKPFIRNYTWKPERGTRIRVVEKDSGRMVRDVRTDAFFGFHHVNAFEENGQVVMDLVTYPDSSIIDQLYLDTLRTGRSITGDAQLSRIRVPLDSPAAPTREILLDDVLELPRIDYGRCAGRPYRYVFGNGSSRPGDFVHSIVRFDLDSRTATTWDEDGCYAGEPVFIPAPDARGEGEGVILSVVLDVRQEQSFLLCLDATDLDELARATVPHHIPFGFHGNYLPDRDSDASAIFRHR